MNGVIEPVVNGFLLGLATGPVCATTCLPVLLSFTLADPNRKGSGQMWRFLSEFLAGRFVAYLCAGVVTGLLGSRMNLFSHRMGTVAWLFLALVLIVYGLGNRLGHLRMCAPAGRLAGAKHFPAFLGLLTGLNVCPPFLLAFAYSLERSISLSFSLFFFTSFFVATSLFVLPVGFIGHVPGRERLEGVGRVAAVAVGLLLFYKGVHTLSMW